MNLFSQLFYWILLLSPLTKEMPERETKYQNGFFEHNGYTLDYQLLYPEHFDPTHPYPLLVFLPEQASSAENPALENALKSYPAVLLLPRKPEEASWTTEPLMEAVMGLIAAQQQLPHIHPDRLYLLGAATGATMVWELLGRIPEKIAAAVSVGGSPALDAGSRSLQVPVWAFHGGKDAASSLRTIERIQTDGGPAKISVFPQMGHEMLDTVLADPGLFPWLFSKFRNEVSSPRVEALLAQMTLEEKIGQLNLVNQGGAVTGTVISQEVENKIRQGQVGGIFGTRGAAKLRKIQQIAVEESRLGIPLITGMDVIHGHQTVFPIPLGISCTWDLELIERSARIAAREATADGLMWNFSPMVDISRDPRWGRIAESNGEDPFLSAAISAAMVRGYQQNDLSDPTTMAACVKHYAAYGAPEGGRDYGTVDMGKVKLHNEYLPPYKAAVDAGVASVMTSFNVVDYLPATANDELLNRVLREQWGFKGFVVTDYTSVNEMIAHGLGDLREVSARSLKAGVDMDMVGEGFLTTLQASLESGLVAVEDIDRACRRILLIKEKLGLLDDPYRYFDEVRAEKEILAAEHRAFARELGAKVQVLLKNEGNVLPLQKSAKIALVGPLADSRRNMMGTWSVSGDFDKSVTVLEGLQAQIGSEGQLFYAKGANISDDPAFAARVNVFGQEITIDPRSPELMIQEALEAAEKADIIVAVMGEAADMSGEASSMADISLQASQQRLLRALKGTGKPIVLVLFNGRPMTLVWENQNMDAILDVWHTGIEAGNAIADVLFGEVNPSGKLSTSFPVHVGQIPVYHSMLNTGRPWDGTGGPKFKSNYLDIPNDPLYPFGYGLSYTTFEFGTPVLSATLMQDKIALSVTVKNTGTRAGEETVQLYLRDVAASISRPVKELKGFKKVFLEPGASTTVRFIIDQDLLKFYNSNLDFVAEPGEFQVFVGPNSRDVQQLSFTYNP
ncbi:MAG: beta-glucosidase BglX [Saprospiraceae bacterium]|nr:beta-glucosidase BglX [Saprospiraceae bacterium]